MLLEGEAWARYFTNFTQSAFRLEVQPTYTMPNEQPTFGRFLAGELTPPEGFNAAWHDTIRANVAAGKTMRRVRVVRKPLTAYQRYGFAWSIPGNATAGEETYVLDVTHLDLDLPTFDFWMFDETTVVHLNYRPDGTQINRELIEDPDLPWYLALRDLALGHAVPFSEYPH